jgi:hypothetical protein
MKKKQVRVKKQVQEQVQEQEQEQKQEQEEILSVTPKKDHQFKNRKVTDDEIAEALEKSHGLVAVAASVISQLKSEALGGVFSVTREALMNRINRIPRLKEIHDNSAESTLDMAELQLVKQMREGNTAALIFYLKCKGKHRGFVEKAIIENVGKDGGPIQQETNVLPPDLSKLSDEQLKAYRDICSALRGEENEVGQPEPEPAPESAPEPGAEPATS